MTPTLLSYISNADNMRKMLEQKRKRRRMAAAPPMVMVVVEEEGPYPNDEVRWWLWE